MPLNRVILALAPAALAMLSACDRPTAAEADARRVAEANCLRAVSEQSGVTGVTASGVSPSGTGTTMMVTVPGDDAPWSCLADASGEVQEVLYTGEG